jgi:hypothetical protein
MGALRQCIVMFLVAAACKSASGPASVQIQTQAPRYQAGEAVTFTVANSGSQDVFLSYCCTIAVALDRWQGSRWLNGNPGGCLAICSMVAIRVPAYGSHLDSAVVTDTGRYRLRVGVASSRDGPPDWSQTSNVFEVR